MKKHKKGSVSVFLAWSMFGFLMLCLVLAEGVRVYYLRAEALQAMELAGFSILSEYQYELFRDYGVFFIDLDYEQGKEQTAVLEQRLEGYLTENAEMMETLQLETTNFCRATDQNGLPFLKQAAELQKTESGYKIFEELLEQAGDFSEEGTDLEADLESYLSGIDLSLPDFSFPSVRALMRAIFGETEDLSEKTIDLENTLLRRSIQQGDGEKMEEEAGEMLLFQSYLLKNFNYYGKENGDRTEKSPEYQIEYVIMGKGSDRENLEQVMWRIFLLRAGSNYLFYHMDGEKMLQAQEKAAAFAGFTGNAAIIEALAECFLIREAVEEGIEETKNVFSGGKVPLYREGVFSGIELGYEEYLFLLLNLVGGKEKVYRCMDVIELEVRESSGYEAFRMDHCICGFMVLWDYRFESLLADTVFGGSGDYEITIRKKIIYEI